MYHKVKVFAELSFLLKVKCNQFIRACYEFYWTMVADGGVRGDHLSDGQVDIKSGIQLFLVRALKEVIL